MHILNYQYHFGAIQDTVELITPTWKGTCMTCWESYYIQTYQQQHLLTEEQSPGELNLYIV